jgi:hypothetical protein
LTGTGPVGPATGLGGQSRVLGRKRPVVRLLRRCRKGGTRSDSSRVAEFTQSRPFQAWLSGGTCLGREHRHAPPQHPLPPRPRKLYRRTDKREQAQEHLATATTMYREMGMTYWLEKAEAEMAT